MSMMWGHGGQLKRKKERKKDRKKERSITSSFLLSVVFISLHYLGHLGILLLHFQDIPISLWFIFSNISVYYIFMFNVFGFSFFLMRTNLIYLIQIFIVCTIQVHIHTIFHHSCECVKWTFIYSSLWVSIFFSVSFSAIYLRITYLFLASVEISLTLSFTYLSYL